MMRAPGSSLRFGVFLFIATAVLLCFCSVIVWSAIYPDGSDPKNIRYVLWKHGLNGHINLDNAAAGMTHDKCALNIVKGMSRDQLKKRFGYVRTVEEALPYLRSCHTQPDTIGELSVPGRKEDVVFLRDSSWMVIFEDGKAAVLVLCKGY